MNLIILIWTACITLTMYVIHRINWADDSIDRISKIILHYRKTLAEDAIYELENNGSKEIAVEILSILKSSSDVDMFIEIMPKSKIIKNQGVFFKTKIVLMPWVWSSSKILGNKKLWEEINNKIYGEGNWK